MEGDRVPRCDGRSRSHAQRNEIHATLEIRDALLPEEDSRRIQKDVGVCATSEERRYTIVGDSRKMKNTATAALLATLVTACATTSNVRKDDAVLPVYPEKDVPPAC